MSFDLSRIPPRPPGEAPVTDPQAQFIRQLDPTMDELDIRKLGKWQARAVIKKLLAGEKKGNRAKSIRDFLQGEQGEGFPLKRINLKQAEAAVAALDERHGDWSADFWEEFGPSPDVIYNFAVPMLATLFPDCVKAGFRDTIPRERKIKQGISWGYWVAAAVLVWLIWAGARSNKVEEIAPVITQTRQGAQQPTQTPAAVRK